MTKLRTNPKAVYRPRFQAEFGQGEDLACARESFRRYYTEAGLETSPDKPLSVSEEEEFNAASE